MKKSIWIFLLAVLLPSIVLGWLALRSAEEQKIILERRTAELRQTEADNVAAAARSLIDEQRRAFADIVGKMIAGEGPQKLAGTFTKSLAQAWPRKAVGFAIGVDGRLLSPSVPAANGSPELKKFLLDNGAFLGGNLVATVYPVPVEELNRPEQMRKGKGAYNDIQQQSIAKDGAPMKQPAAKQEIVQLQTRESETKADALNMKQALKGAAIIQPAPQPSAQVEEAQAPAADRYQQSDATKLDEQEAVRREASVRNVKPQQNFNEGERTQASNLWSATTEFRALCAGRDDGMVTRFVQDRLDMIFWLRPAQAPEMVFGCLIEADSLGDLWAAAMPGPASSEFVLALLDDKARPVVTHPAGEKGRDWKRPFVASEIGEALPHWEAALYLMRPEQLQESARALRRTLIFLIVGMLGAIACGGWLVVHDARLQLARAQQKTDFVSNVSHELKTPLTSIRMFAELMQNGRPETAEKAPQYLRIIMVEAERLTRLINNVLDFAKLERRQKRFDKKPLDLHAVIGRTWESHELHLRE
ncbi:MAG: histidine kinase dimerization/phospho-acceptor domain-containing protein, partial [Chthoniobacteraceae bacterium]